ncbi:MAG: hypothetical protein AAF441_24990, partial [Pseudomonadota bacterium]
MHFVTRCALALVFVFSLASAASAVPIDQGSKRLLDESSPYLRQHADNPVNNPSDSESNTFQQPPILEKWLIRPD